MTFVKCMTMVLVLFACTRTSHAKNKLQGNLCDPVQARRAYNNLKKKLDTLRSEVERLKKRNVKIHRGAWYAKPTKKTIPIYPKHVTLLTKTFKTNRPSHVLICGSAACWSEDGSYFLTLKLNDQSPETGHYETVGGMSSRVPGHGQSMHSCAVWKLKKGSHTFHIMATRGKGAKRKAHCWRAGMSVLQISL